MASTRIADLAAAIHSNTTKLDEYLKAQGIKSPSFDIDAPEKLDLPPAIAGLREHILDATDELHHIVQGPVQYLTGFDVGRPGTRFVKLLTIILTLATSIV